MLNGMTIVVTMSVVDRAADNVAQITTLLLSYIITVRGWL